jgi:hypothetical protein
VRETKENRYVGKTVCPTAKRRLRQEICTATTSPPDATLLSDPLWHSDQLSELGSKHEPYLSGDVVRVAMKEQPEMQLGGAK